MKFKHSDTDGVIPISINSLLGLEGPRPGPPPPGRYLWKLAEVELVTPGGRSADEAPPELKIRFELADDPEFEGRSVTFVMDLAQPEVAKTQLKSLYAALGLLKPGTQCARTEQLEGEYVIAHYGKQNTHDRVFGFESAYEQPT